MKLLNRWLRALGCIVLVIAGNAWAQLVPNWTSAGPSGGSVTALLSDPIAQNSLYAGTDLNGMFLSTDVGATWVAANAGMSSQGGRRVYSLAYLGNFVYAATDGGVYVTPAGSAPQWTRLVNPAIVACDYTMLQRVADTLYLAAACDSRVYSTTNNGLAPGWKAVSVPSRQNVTALGELEGNIAIGTSDTVFLLDILSNTFVSSESGLAKVALSGTVVSIASNSSRWAFACTLDGGIFQGDLSGGIAVVNWRRLSFASETLPSSCNRVNVLRAASNPPQWVVAVATDSGALVSSPFDDLTSDAPNLLPGPVFPMTNHVNAAVQFAGQSQSVLLWATEFGVYSNLLEDLFKWLSPTAPLVLNGPVSAASAGQRLNNVNVADVVLLGSNLYAIVEASGRPSYADVLRSSDAGTTWERTGLTADYWFSASLGRLRILTIDTANKVLYAGTTNGVFAYRESTRTWYSMGNAFDVRALAVGSQALYVGRDATTIDEGGAVHLLSGGGLVIQSLLDQPSFSIPTEMMGSFPADLSVRALTIDRGKIYAAGGIARNADGLYENAVYFANDYAPNIPAPAWTRVGGAQFASKLLPVLSRLAVSAGQVFAGGDGFLRQCAKADALWTDVPGLPLLSNGDGESVSSLATDGEMLYAGIYGGGIWSWKIGSGFSMQSINANGGGSSSLPSALINAVRFMDGRIFVASSAGVSVASPVQATQTVASESSGGGCSIARTARPDPVLWLMVLLAAWITIRRRGELGGRAQYRPLAGNDQFAERKELQ